MQVAKVVLSVGPVFSEEAALDRGEWGPLLCEDERSRRLTIAGHPDLAQFSGGSGLTVRQEVESCVAAPTATLQRSGWPEDWGTETDPAPWMALDISSL